MVRPQRRKLVWATTIISSTAITSANTATVDLLQGFEVAGGSKLGVTVMRQHLGINVTFGTVAANAGWQLATRIGNSGEVTTVIQPSNQSESDWMIYRALLPTWSGATQDAELFFDIDVRSKRKCEELGQTLIFYLQNAGGANGSFSLFSRVLLALP
jgi:hypothetical protein